MSAPMSEQHRDILRICRGSLVQDLNVKDILDYMIGSGVINEYMREGILSNPTRQEQVRSFLDILIRRGSDAMRVFLDALGKDYGHLVNVIKEAEDQFSSRDRDTGIYMKLSDVKQNNRRMYSGCSLQSLSSEQPHQSLSSEQPRLPQLIYNELSSDNCRDMCQTATVTKQCSAMIMDKTRWKISSGNTFKEPKINIQTRLSNFQRHSVVNMSISLSQHCDNLNSTKVPKLRGCDQYFKSKKMKCLSKGDTIFLPPEDSNDIQFSDGVCQENVIGFDSSGDLLNIPSNILKLNNDPTGESWFYPCPLTEHQAALLLHDHAVLGVFIIHEPCPRAQGVAFVLSMTLTCGQSKKFQHYPIRRATEDKLVVFGDRSFWSLKELVTYYRATRDLLPCRLRLAPSEIGNKINPGADYPTHWHIKEEKITILDSDTSTCKQDIIKAKFGGMIVAVKFLKPLLSPQPWAIQDFYEEAMLMIKLDHRNIVQVIGFSFHPNAYIVMECITQGTLLDYLKNSSNKLSLCDIISMFVQILSCLDYLASKSYIIHRDIAARNVLVGENFCLKLSNFAKAREVPYDSCIGDPDEEVSVRWAAPEVLNSLLFSTKSDLWSAGVLFWEVLSEGKTPYSGLSNEAAIEKVAAGERLPPPKFNYDNVEEIYNNVVIACWIMTPLERPDASDLLRLVKLLHDDDGDFPRSSSDYVIGGAVPSTCPAKDLSNNGMDTIDLVTEGTVGLLSSYDQLDGCHMNGCHKGEHMPDHNDIAEFTEKPVRSSVAQNGTEDGLWEKVIAKSPGNGICMLSGQTKTKIKHLKKGPNLAV